MSNPTEQEIAAVSNGTPLMGYSLKQDLHRIDELAKAGMLPPGPYEQTR